MVGSSVATETDGVLGLVEERLLVLVPRWIPVRPAPGA